MNTLLTIIHAASRSPMSLPYADGGVKAGFPSPAQDYMEDSIDLNEYMIRQKATTFYARVDGTSMTGAGIFDGDIVIIDKGLEAHSGDYVVAYVNGEFTLKRFVMDHGSEGGWLIPANDRYKPIRVTAEDDFRIWGVVTGVVRKLRDGF